MNKYLGVTVLVPLLYVCAAHCCARAVLVMLSASVTRPRIGESTLLADPLPLPLDGPEKLEVEPPDADAEHDAE